MDYSDAQNLALLLLRVSLGLMMAAHGYAKVFRGGRLAGTAGWFDSIGMRPGRLHAPLAAGSEIGSGLLMALGLLHSFAAMAMIGASVVAAWTVHRHNGFFIISEGWEYTFIIAVAAAALAILGPGEWSIDQAIGLADDLDGLTGLALALAGVAAGAAQVAVFFRPPAATD
ncbi:MAG: DoxX family protein [Acidimicrobiia bacterium]|nr:DoxX family protein [Acidimicrobiia bacterium]